MATEKSRHKEKKERKEKKAKKDKSVTFDEVVDILNDTNTKKASKSRNKNGTKTPVKEKEKKKKNSKKMDIDVPTAAAPESKKRKVDAAALDNPEEGEKKASPDLNTPARIFEWLQLLSIKVDEKALRTLKAQNEQDFNELAKMMTDPSEKGLIYQFSVKTPIGRMFWYSDQANAFKNVAMHHNVVRLTQYAKEASLNVDDCIKQLSDAQRKTVLQCLGVTETGADSLKTSQWLFALIETNVLERSNEKCDYKQCMEPYLLHDTMTKHSYWLGSKDGKAKLGRIVLSRTRAVTDKNIDSEYGALLKKRTEIIDFLKKALGSSSTVTTLPPPSQTPILSETKKKSKKATTTAKTMDVEEPAVSEKQSKKAKKAKKAKKSEKETPAPPAKKAKKEKATKAPTPTPTTTSKPTPKPINVDVSESSVFTSESSVSASASASVSEEEIPEEVPMTSAEAQMMAQLKKKQKIDPSTTLAQVAAKNGKIFEVKANIEQAKMLQKALQDKIDPDIVFLRTNYT